MNFPFSVTIRFHGNCPTDLGPATCHLSFLQFFVPQSAAILPETLIFHWKKHGFPLGFLLTNPLMKRFT
jgi:hypothetical protein